MEIGISTASYFTKCMTEEALIPIAKIGANVCEVFFASHCEYTKEFSEVILGELHKAKEFGSLRVDSVHALSNQFEPELFSVNCRAFDDSLKTFRNVLSTAQQIGAKYYTFHGATVLKKAVQYSFNFAHISNRVNLLCSIAKEYDVTLCYENVHWTYFCYPEYFENVKKLCPQVGAVLDIKQARQSGIDYNDYLKAMGDRLRNVHLCDYDIDGNVTIPGKGVFDFVKLFKTLLDNGYKGNCLMEVYAKSYSNEEELKESYNYLVECLRKAENLLIRK